MHDEYLDLFLAELGEATIPKKVTDSDIEIYRGKLPEKLLEYWMEVGWSGFGDGVFWLTNPVDFDHLVDIWLEGSEFLNYDRYRVIGRTAFGELYLMGERTSQMFTINCPMHAIIAMKHDLQKKSQDPTAEVQSFFAMSDKERYDIEDINDVPLFDQALKKLGPLSSNEVYGFEPALIAGGNLSVDNLAKLDLDIHLTILRQMAPPQIPF